MIDTFEAVTLLSIVEALLQLSMIVMVGLYFIFSNTVMRVLATHHNGAEVMNGINAVILNPLFLFLFAVSGAAGVYFFWFHTGFQALSGLVFFIGTTVVTMLFNVPLNNKLKDAGSEHIASIWAEYLTRWVKWNHVRTICGVISGFLLSL
jgi:uncharacterized membrane protein